MYVYTYVYTLKHPEISEPLSCDDVITDCAVAVSVCVSNNRNSIALLNTCKCDAMTDTTSHKPIGVPAGVHNTHSHVLSEPVL